MLSLKGTDALAVEAYNTASAGDGACALPPTPISLQLGEDKAIREASVVPRSIVRASDKRVTEWSFGALVTGNVGAAAETIAGGSFGEIVGC